MFSISRLKNKVVSAHLLLDQSQKMKIDQSESQTSIFLPSKPADNPPTVIVVETNGLPQVNPMIVLQKKDGSMNLDYQKAITHCKAMRRFNRKGGYHISKWTELKDSVEWFIHVDKAGAFKVGIEYGAKKNGKVKGLSWWSVIRFLTCRYNIPAIGLIILSFLRVI